MNKVRLGDIVSRIKDFEDKDNTDLLYYVGGEHFDNRSLTVNRKGIIKGSTIGPAFHTKFTRGDVLLMSRNPHLRKAGIVNFDGICSDVSYIIRTKDEKIIKQKFIPLLFQSDIFWNFAERNKKGSTNFFLNWSDFEKFEFDLPNIDEQEKLCEVLWAIDDTLKSYQEQIKQCDELVKGQFVEMFGELGKKHKNYEYKCLGDCSIVNPVKNKSIMDDTKVSFVPMTAVSEKGEIDSSCEKEYKEVKKGFTYFEERDVLFAKITPCMENGKGAIASNLINGIGIGSTEFHVLRPLKNVSNSYWLYILTTLNDFRTDAKKVMTGTGGQLRVPADFLKNYKVTLPPIELQDEFAEFYKHLDKSKFAIKEAMKNAQKIFDGILKESLK